MKPAFKSVGGGCLGSFLGAASGAMLGSVLGDIIGQDFIYAGLGAILGSAIGAVVGGIAGTLQTVRSTEIREENNFERSHIPQSDMAGVTEPSADPELHRLVEAWPTLPDHVRKSILSLFDKSIPPER